MANTTPSSRGHTLYLKSTNVLVLHIGSKTTHILSKSGKLCSCNFTIVIKEWEMTFFHHYVSSECSDTPSYARLHFKSTQCALSNVDGRSKPTAQFSITFHILLATAPKTVGHVPLSRNITGNHLRPYPTWGPIQSTREQPLQHQIANQGDSLSPTLMLLHQLRCSSPHASPPETGMQHLSMQQPMQRLLSNTLNEGAHHATLEIKYSTQLEKATTAMLWSHAPMHGAMQASIDAIMSLYKYGQPIALKLYANKTTIIKYYKDYTHPLCIPARGNMWLSNTTSRTSMSSCLSHNWLPPHKANPISNCTILPASPLLQAMQLQKCKDPHQTRRASVMSMHLLAR